MSRSYAVVIEQVQGNVSADVPNLPGFLATGVRRDVVLEDIRDAIAFHLEGLAADAQAAPRANTSVTV